MSVLIWCSQDVLAVSGQQQIIAEGGGHSDHLQKVRNEESFKHTADLLPSNSPQSLLDTRNFRELRGVFGLDGWIDRVIFLLIQSFSCSKTRWLASLDGGTGKLSKEVRGGVGRPLPRTSVIEHAFKDKGACIPCVQLMYARGVEASPC